MQTRQKNKMRVTGSKPRSTPPSKEAEMQVQYTPAKPFNRNRFLLHMATVLAVVLAVVLVMSIFFKVSKVMVSGTEKYTPWEIKEAAGIQDGDALLSLSEAKITAKIQEKLPYVGDVRVGIKLPDTVNIEIKELEVVYAVEDCDGAWWLMDASGRIVDSTNLAAAKDYTRLTGVKIQSGAVGEQAEGFQPEAETLTPESGQPAVTLPSVSAAEQFRVAVRILSALEKNGVMGTVDTVDVADPADLSLVYDNRYQVTLGDASRLEYKIGAMKSSVTELGQYQSGYLDVSFTIWPNEVGYRPFDNESAKK